MNRERDPLFTDPIPYRWVALMALFVLVVMAVLFDSPAAGQLPPACKPAAPWRAWADEHCPSPVAAQWLTAMATTTEADAMPPWPSPWTYTACGSLRWGCDYEKHGYLHQTDHQYALQKILGREPTRLEIGDSWIAGDGAPTESRLMDPDDGTLIYCLIRLYRSMSRGTREWGCLVEKRLMCNNRPVMPECADRLPGVSAPTPTPVPTPPPDEPATCWACPAYVPATAPPRVVETAEDASGWKVIGPGRAARLREWWAWTMEVLAEMYEPAPATYTRPSIISCLESPTMPGTCEEEP